MDFQEKVINHLSQYDYDLRKSNNGRWTDQKCTPDVVAIVADCVVNYVEKYGVDVEFISTDIWHFDYTEQNVEAIFNKPSTRKKKSRNEYDKFFSQPLELLAYSGILSKEKKGRSNYYTVNQPILLDNIGTSVRKSYVFLVEYIKKVLSDSGLKPKFASFFNRQTVESYDYLKKSFADYYHEHTNIKGKFEPNRIFSKVLNPLACSKGLRGTLRGRISKQPITYSELMYNRLNIRDEISEKPKNMTRKEWAEERALDQDNIVTIQYQVERAKGAVRRFNSRYFYKKSEIEDEYAAGDATQMHHIFPQHSYQEIASYVENIIALTPTQHFYKAHPDNNTSIINPYYQEICLKAKLATIKYSLEDKSIDSIYDFDDFIHVINVGFDNEYSIETGNYSEAYNVIEEHYANYYY